MLRCESRNIWIVAGYMPGSNNVIVAGYIPGSNNVIADKMSRVFCSNTEWSLDIQSFKDICDQFGTPTIDLFAD